MPFCSFRFSLTANCSSVAGAVFESVLSKNSPVFILSVAVTLTLLQIMIVFHQRFNKAIYKVDDNNRNCQHYKKNYNVEGV